MKWTKNFWEHENSVILEGNKVPSPLAWEIILFITKLMLSSLTYLQYMAVMIIIFLILFCVSVAALAITSSQQHSLLKKAWGLLSNNSKKEVQELGHCCGFENATIESGMYGHPNCTNLKVFMRIESLHYRRITAESKQSPYSTKVTVLIGSK